MLPECLTRLALFTAVISGTTACGEGFTGDEQWAGEVGNTDACTALPFAQELPVPEASGAAWIVVAGAPAILVVGDSSNDGAYAIVDPDTGDSPEQGHLPLGSGAGDDIEGLATVDGTISGLTSAGWLRTWRRTGADFVLTDGPYAIATVDGSAGGFACKGSASNCGKNYEGLCLSPLPVAPGRCAGFAASKADGRLYCLASAGARLRLDPSRAIDVTDADHLSDCGFAPDGSVLWAGTNHGGGGRVYVIDGWADPATASARGIDTIGPNSPEVLLPGNGGLVYRFADPGDAPSFASKYQCTVGP